MRSSQKTSCCSHKNSNIGLPPRERCLRNTPRRRLRPRLTIVPSHHHLPATSQSAAAMPALVYVVTACRWHRCKHTLLPPSTTLHKTDGLVAFLVTGSRSSLTAWMRSRCLAAVSPSPFAALRSPLSSLAAGRSLRPNSVPPGSSRHPAPFCGSCSGENERKGSGHGVSQRQQHTDAYTAVRLCSWPWLAELSRGNGRRRKRCWCCRVGAAKQLLIPRHTRPPC